MDHRSRHAMKNASYLASIGLLTTLALPNRAQAEEPRLVSEPYLLAEPAEVTQVVDAFDEGDPFDLNLSIGYQFSQLGSSILRETGESGKSSKVAQYRETTHRLLTRADIGLYHDIALVVRVPIILANDRKLEGSGSAENQQLGTAGSPSDTVPLFGLPFNSPTRSGIEYLALGLDFGILNQYRDSSKPTWVFGFEGRFDVSSPMHACNNAPASGQLSCADPSDVNRDGTYTTYAESDGVPLENSTFKNRDKGVSRGTTGLEIHTLLSKRIKYIEPYAGLKFLAEFPTSDSDYGLTNFESSLVNKPPLEGTIIVGLSVIPWEVRNAHQRATLDFRFSSTYRSEGRDYSELFDALGSSEAASLRRPVWSEYQASANGNSVVNTDSERVYVTGLTDVQQHVKNRLSTEFVWQAAKYVKFGAGLGYTMVQSHYLTYDQACNASVTSDEDKSGPCRKDSVTSGGTVDSSDFRVTGIPNPNYRSSINAVGHRYRVDDSSLLDGWLSATVMF